jgi:regulation of enolase protein 1 (concanavalin A-like superfamily)
MLDLPELPFPLTPSHPDVWRRDEPGALVATAPARTDLYVDPGAPADPQLGAPTLLGTPPEGDFQLSARVTVDFRAQYDAGVLLLWTDATHWAKFCFEFSPDDEPMVVSVVTREVSDDANAFVVDDRSVWLRVSRIDRTYAFHASTDGTAWRLVRFFSLGDRPAEVGFEAQSPTGDGCTVTFTEVGFRAERLADLRDGS